MSDMRKEFNGAIETATNTRDYEYAVVSGTSDVSGASTITDNFPKEFQLDPTTIKDQGNWGACVGCASATVMESHYKKQMSHGWIYGKCRNEDEKNKGMIHTRTLKYLTEIGAVPQDVFDILLEMPDIKLACQKFPELVEEAIKYRLSGYVAIFNGDTRTGGRKDLEIKDALTKSREHLFAIAPDYFGSSHAISIIGWDDEKDVYIIQNSWGEDYGNKGITSVPKRRISYVYQFLYEDIKFPFEDVKETDWFYNDVKHAWLSGLMCGKSDTIFDPHGNVTRAELSAVSNRILKKVDQSIDTMNKLINIKHQYNQLGEKVSND